MNEPERLLVRPTFGRPQPRGAVFFAARVPERKDHHVQNEPETDLGRTVRRLCPGNHRNEGRVGDAPQVHFRVTSTATTLSMPPTKSCGASRPAPSAATQTA